MTILPKKKQNKNASNDDDREKEHSNERYNFAQLNTNQNGQISPNSRAWPSRNDDKRSAPDSDCPTDHSGISGSHLKRRHRTNRERDGSEIQRSLIDRSVRTKAKSSLNSPSSSPRDHSNNENELTLTGGILNHCEKNDINRSNILGLDIPEEEELEEEDKKDISGYNSGDEYQKPKEHWTNIDWEEKERNFERKLRKNGFIIKKMCEDGACLFRAVADQLYGDQEMHSAVRKMCMDYMEKNCDYFSSYVTENYSDYIQRKRSENSHGNHVEIQALSEIFNRPIQVYIYSTEPYNIFQSSSQTDNEPIRLSYHRGVHYNSIVNPYKATIGVGLGLPGFKPGLAEKTLMEKAMLISEQHELEQAMLEDKIRATDWEATNEAIEEQIARESYLEWLRETELRSRKKSCATSTLTKLADDDAAASNASSPKCYSPRALSKSPSRERESRKSPKRNEMIENENAQSVSAHSSKSEISSFLHEVPPSMLGLQEWEDDDILTRTLAQSQAEYIESLKSIASSSSTDSSSAKETAESTESTTSTTSCCEYYSSPSTSSNYRA